MILFKEGEDYINVENAIYQNNISEDSHKENVKISSNDDLIDEILKKIDE